MRIASGESQDSRLGRSGCEVRSFFVLCLYSFKAASKMDRKFEWEVDVEGSVDMVARREVKGSRRGVNGRNVAGGKGHQQMAGDSRPGPEGIDARGTRQRQPTKPAGAPMVE